MKIPKNYRFNTDTLAMLEALQEHFKVTETMMVEMSIQQMAKKWLGEEETEKICMEAWQKERD